MHFELLEGEEWRGEYRTRRAAMADAELMAAERGRSLRWVRVDEDGRTSVGLPQPGADHPPFTLRTGRGLALRR